MIHGDTDVTQALFKKEIHEEWISDYESGSNDAFYEVAIDTILSRLSYPKNVTILDAGCGDAFKSIRLAARGLRGDSNGLLARSPGFSKKKIEDSSFSNLIDLRQDDLCALSFHDGAFDYVLCWGVLMHIPSVETAVQELARVTRSKGFLVIQESDMSSLQSVAQRSLMRLLRKDMSAIKMTERGAEKWRQTTDGILLKRNADIEWLIRCVEANGLKLYIASPANLQFYTCACHGNFARKPSCGSIANCWQMAGWQGSPLQTYSSFKNRDGSASSLSFLLLSPISSGQREPVCQFVNEDAAIAA
jgi:2-polyprenyl-3-methyl-5-hydroxy-6-metoxy-1,4-benzoquinol methylase